MPKIKLDDMEYNTEDLSEHARGLLKSLQFAEIQLQQIQNEIAVYQTAKKMYFESLKSEINAAGLKHISEGDTSDS